ncbi:hypothetical protein B0T26DRAFT_872731 [Lasiosphaeria miniovina]|uniref:Uncharacterized protein n=1 Tax=Lasiosphaeria miniovina TaxID=1954250 RepID=A0AA40AMJ8_9PEZI|nr:uncharacterized protein B0T26DRAFT_872731 [Lasiosphaeria miniovina]KAK0718569.1 hypothetical protein B0T26DRAFT_872731 [Lasiosphaeria miniovina]
MANLLRATRNASRVGPRWAANFLYCSSACQTSDAPVHKLLCDAFSASVAPGSGGSQQSHNVRAILFPADADAAPPSLVGVRIAGFRDPESGIAFPEAEVHPFFESLATKRSPEALTTDRNRVRNRDTRSMLEVWHVPAATGDGESGAGGGGGGGGGGGVLNGCIISLAKNMASGEAGPFYPWSGPVLVLAMTRPTGFMVDPGAYRDCTLHDCRDAVDFVVDYGNAEHEKRIQEALATLGAGSTAEEVSKGDQEGVAVDENRGEGDVVAGDAEDRRKRQDQPAEEVKKEFAVEMEG